FIEHDVSLAIAPLATILLVAKTLAPSQCTKDALERQAVLHLGLRLDARLVGKLPLVAILADAQHLAARAQHVTRKVVEHVHLVRPGHLLAKTRRTQL